MVLDPIGATCGGWAAAGPGPYDLAGAQVEDDRGEGERWRVEAGCFGVEDDETVWVPVGQVDQGWPFFSGRRASPGAWGWLAWWVGYSSALRDRRVLGAGLAVTRLTRMLPCLRVVGTG